MDERSKGESLGTVEDLSESPVEPPPESPKNEYREIFNNETQSDRKFGTAAGVFRPTILTILGVMMYLREGWVVGNAGLLGGIGVILACYLITGTTAMSISSISTNMRMGSGGVFSIISQSLGLEVGGSVGIPLYLAQGLSASLYLQGIVETWLYMFPEHHSLAVVMVVFAVAFGVSSLSTGIAFKTQVFVMIGVILALGSMLAGLSIHPINPTPVLIGDFEHGNFGVLFAVFFPAATGIMVGSSLSGTLKSPRKSIPIGTMMAWGISLFVYLALAVWYALLGSPEELKDTTHIFAVQKAFWGPAVLIGIMSSCFSASLSSLVAGPRVLAALGGHRILPFSDFFQKLRNGEPRNASLFTGGMVLIALLLGDLNSLARVLTIFFLVIYFMINLVLLIEQRLQMISFRPRFKAPFWVPFVGSLSSFVAILVINPVTGLVALAFALSLYVYLDHKHLETPWETVHSGLFVSIAHWAARKVFLNPRQSLMRSWKPDLIIPVERSTQFEGYYRIVRAIVQPQGTVQVVGLIKDRAEFHRKTLDALTHGFQEEGIFATTALLVTPNFIDGLKSCIAITKGSFFKPNTLFCSVETRSPESLAGMVEIARENQMGLVFLALHPESRFGRERTINLWVRDQSPDWRLGLNLANLDYAVLMAYQLKKNWKAEVRIITVVKDAAHLETAREFLQNLVAFSRIGSNVEIDVRQGDFLDQLASVPRADLNILGLVAPVNKQALEDLRDQLNGSCLFVMDSGRESALA